MEKWNGGFASRFMKVKFETCFRGFVFLLFLSLAWGLWAGAQPAANRDSQTPTTNSSPSALVTKFSNEHYVTFGLDRVAFLRENKIFGEPIWKYVASLIYVLLAFYAAKLLDLIALVWLKKLAAKTKTRADDILLDLLHGPVKVIVFVVLLHLGLNIFDWSPKAKSWFSKGLILIVAGSLTYLALKIVDALLEIWGQRHVHEADHKFNTQLFSIIRRSLNTFIIIVAILVTASNIGINITAAITSLSIGGLAVGLAAQDTLANLFGAIAVYADKPFRVGDQIKLDAAEGTVEAVGMRSTRVRHPEGHLIAVPNKIMGNAPISNMTRRTSIKTTMNLTLARTLPADKVKRALAILDEIYRGHSTTQDAWISFNQFAGGNINIMITHWWKGTDYQRYLAGMQEMNLAVKEQFDKEGITFA
jgi:MscS family membrane protein